MALFGVGVFVGSIVVVATTYLQPDLSMNLLLGAVGLAALGVLVGGVGVARAEAKWEP
ncbi:hypothetical protein HSB1_26210 [Halogranum salarium B-1]|nr:hypothetical protein HSB1_26210 [Halogranum salarium B-1]